MPAEMFITGPSLTKEQVDAAAVTLPPVPDNVRIHLRYLQDQVAALTERVEALEA